MDKNAVFELPVLEEEAIKLFEQKTTRRSRGKLIDLRVMKFKNLYIYGKYDFYWVQFINDRPQIDLALKVMSKNPQTKEVFEGAFFVSFEDKHIMQMKRTEKVADRYFLLNRIPKIKYLAVVCETEAKEILQTKEVYIASIRVKNGKYAFPVWLDADIKNGYKTVSFWGRKQTMKEVDFISKVEIGEKLYRKAFVVGHDDNGQFLIY